MLSYVKLLLLSLLWIDLNYSFSGHSIYFARIIIVYIITLNQIFCMRRRGQAELVILVGIVAVIAIVAFFILSTGDIVPNPLPSSVNEEKKLVEDSITNVGRQGADHPGAERGRRVIADRGEGA